MRVKECLACGKRPLDKDTIGINKSYLVKILRIIIVWTVWLIT